MTLILITITTLCEKYHITPEQFDKATHCESNGVHFYIVESQTTPGTEYHVKYNREYNALSCTCLASDNGNGCWHRRAALASEEHYKATEQARRLQEQAEVESTPEYQFEQAIQEFHQAMSKFEQYTAEFNQIIEEASEREKSRREAERLNLPLNGNKGFRLLR